MKPSRLFAWLCLLAAAPLSGLADEGPPIRARALVPSSDRPHGEVRLVAVDGEIVVQTVLRSRVLRRVVGRIAAKERSGWPPGSAGGEDAERYVAGLAEAVEQIRAAASPAGDRYRSLCIEFPPARGEGRVLISGARVEESAEGLRLIEKTAPRLVLEVSAGYVERNRRLIVADAFLLDEDAAADLLDEGGPRRGGAE